MKEFMIVLTLTCVLFAMAVSMSGNLSDIWNIEEKIKSQLNHKK